MAAIDRELQLEKSHVFCGDSFKLSKLLPDSSVDLIVSSPPYNIGKAYEKGLFENFDQYVELLTALCSDLEKKLSASGSICWQVGNYVRDGKIIPLDYVFYEIFSKLGLVLRNRIVWRFNFGLNATHRLSGRYETVLWFTRPSAYRFNLDPIRVRQLYPGKTKCKDGVATPSGNPKGKNPSDFWEFDAKDAFFDDPVWDIPNVKANHPEKTTHPCQFPNEVAERCILAFSNPGDIVLDPFAGVGTVTSCANAHGRVGIGFELDSTFAKLANERLILAAAGDLPLRKSGVLPRRPKPNEKVARLPDDWLE